MGMDNPLPNMTWLEQAAQFQVDVIGPVEGTISSVLESLGFECNVNWMKFLENKDRLEAKTYNADGAIYILIYNATELGKWRKGWAAHLQPGDPTYKRE